MKIALASPPYPASIKDGLEWVEKLTKEAALQQGAIICFPEFYIRGYPGMGADPAERTPDQLEAALQAVLRTAVNHSIAVIIPMDWYLKPFSLKEFPISSAFIKDSL
jgi:predicted amidohydrolase